MSVMYTYGFFFKYRPVRWISCTKVEAHVIYVNCLCCHVMFICMPLLPYTVFARRSFCHVRFIKQLTEMYIFIDHFIRTLFCASSTKVWVAAKPFLTTKQYCYIHRDRDILYRMFIYISCLRIYCIYSCIDSSFWWYMHGYLELNKIHEC